MTLLPLLEAMRPRQWSKNVFVLAGIVFAGRLFEARAELRVLACFALFCAASSAVYLANDGAARASDAPHPLKRTRPIASGRLSPALGIAASAVLTLVALAGTALLNRATLAVMAAYLASTFAYSLGLKRAFLLDVMIVAAGFVLGAGDGASRLEAGGLPLVPVWSVLPGPLFAPGQGLADLRV